MCQKLLTVWDAFLPFNTIPAHGPYVKGGKNHLQDFSEATTGLEDLKQLSLEFTVWMEGGVCAYKEYSVTIKLQVKCVHQGFFCAVPQGRALS